VPLYAGIDVGVRSVKAVVFDGTKILGKKVRITTEESDRAARELYGLLLAGLHLSPSGVERLFVTGCGAKDVSFADGRSSEEVCAARGARFLMPSVRTVVDMGAEGCRVMRLGADGALEEFANNSKCASGTGSFLELAAVYLQVDVDDLGPLALAADGVADVSSQCAIFAESVIISHIHNGESLANIAAGIHLSAAVRVTELMRRIRPVEEVAFVGGAAANKGLVRVLEEMNGTSLKIPDDPRIVVALGAALQAAAKKGIRRRNGGLDPGIEPCS
jgi:predicted CoA-substrate-specific enzyme activase